MNTVKIIVKTKLQSLAICGPDFDADGMQTNRRQSHIIHQYDHVICLVLEILPACESCQGWLMHARASLNLFTDISITHTGSESRFNLQTTEISKILTNTGPFLEQFSIIFAKMTK